MPDIVFVVAWVGSLAAAAWAQDNGKSAYLASPAPTQPVSAAPPLPPPPPSPEPLTAEGQALRRLLDRPTEFDDSWSALMSSLGAAEEEASSAPASSLQARVAEVRRREDGRRVLVDALQLIVAREFSEASLELLPSTNAIGPGVTLPAGAATLARVVLQFPGQSAKQVQAFVTEAAPLSDEGANGRVDRLQAAQLYLGHVQFGYFIAQIFRGQAGLSDDSVVDVEEAQRIKGQIEQAAQMMRSEVAWAAASRRAGGLFGLSSADGSGGSSASASASLGIEELRLFSKGVQVVATAQQAEFFASPSDDGQGGVAAAAAGGATGAALLPSASFVGFNAAGLQCALAEGCLFGWHLWAAEAAASQALGDATARALMIPPERGSS